MRARFIVPIALALLCACSSSNTAPDGGTPPPPPPGDAAVPPADTGPGRDTGTPPADAGPTPELLSLDIGPISANPGEEDTVCIVLDLGNEGPVRITGIDTHIRSSSHHMIVYKVDRQPERPTPSPCFPFADILAGGQPLFIAQQPEAGIDYPEGTAFHLEAHQMIKLEMHYINYFGEPVDDIGGTVDFHLAPPAAGELEAVDMIFWGTTDINVSARSEGQSVMYRRVPGPSGAGDDAIKIFGLTSHTHQWGELTTIFRATGPTADDRTQELHTNTTWAEPPLDVFEPPLEFDGSDGLQLTCNYFNESSSRVGFGEGFKRRDVLPLGVLLPVPRLPHRLLTPPRPRHIRQRNRPRRLTATAGCDTPRSPRDT